MSIQTAAQPALAIIFSYLHIDEALRVMNASKCIWQNMRLVSGSELWAAPGPIPLIVYIRGRVSLCSFNRAILYGHVVMPEGSMKKEIALLCKEKRDDIFFRITSTNDPLMSLKNPPITKKNMRIALFGNSPKIAEWFRTQDRTLYNSEDVLDAIVHAYCFSNFAMTKYLESVHTPTPYRIWNQYSLKHELAALSRLCYLGNFESIRLMVKKYPIDPNNETFMHRIVDAFQKACSTGHLHIAQWLTKRFKLVRDISYRYAIHNCVWYTNIKVARWVIGKFRLTILEIDDGIGRAWNEGGAATDVAFQLAKYHGLIDKWLARAKMIIESLDDEIHTCGEQIVAANLKIAANTNKKIELANRVRRLRYL